MDDGSISNHENSGTRLKNKKVVFAVGAIILFLFLLYLVFQIFRAHPAGESSDKPSGRVPGTVPSEASLSDSKFLAGVWKKETGDQPLITAFNDTGGVCTSWSGIGADDFICYQYEQYSVEGNKLLIKGNYWMEWRIADGKLELKQAHQDDPAEIYTRLPDTPPKAVKNPANTEIPTVSKQSLPQEIKLPTPAPEPLRLPKESPPGKITYRNPRYGFEIIHTEDRSPEQQNKIYQSYHKNDKIDLWLDLVSPPEKWRQLITVKVFSGATEAEIIKKYAVEGVYYNHQYAMPVDAGGAYIGKENYPVRKFTAGNFAEFYILERNLFVYYIFVGYHDSKAVPAASVKKELGDMISTLSFFKPDVPAVFPKVLSPIGGEEWNMDKRTYSVKWTKEDMSWSDGYAVRKTSGSRALLYLFGYDEATRSVRVGEAAFDSGEFELTVPYSSEIGLGFDIALYPNELVLGIKHYRTFFNSPVRLLIEIHPWDKKVKNPLVMLSEPFVIKPLTVKNMPVFVLPQGGEQIKIGTPLKIQWTTLPPNILAHELYLMDQANYYGWAGIIVKKNPVGLTDYEWDGKTVIFNKYNAEGISESVVSDIKPGRYKIGLDFLMPDYFAHTVESDYFDVIPKD